jgi:hypothetical protein
LSEARATPPVSPQCAFGHIVYTFSRTHRLHFCPADLANAWSHQRCRKEHVFQSQNPATSKRAGFCDWNVRRLRLRFGCVQESLHSSGSPASVNDVFGRICKPCVRNRPKTSHPTGVPDQGSAGLGMLSRTRRGIPDFGSLTRSPSCTSPTSTCRICDLPHQAALPCFGELPP